MEVKPGYKQTEVGVIPEEWETAAIADLVEPSAPICYGVVQVGQHTESGVPIVAIKFVKEIAHAPLHRTAVNLEQPYARSRPKGGDVLISIKGTIGRVGIVPNEFEGNISRELARLRIREGLCPEYIAHQLESGATQERIMRSVVGTTRLEFSIATLRKFPLPVPPTLPEQRAIATALSDVDVLLGGQDRLIAKKRDLKQAAMQQLLTGQTRLPGFHAEWEVQRLGDVVQINNGQLITSSTLKPGDIPVIAGGKQPAYYHACANRFGRTVTISASGASAGYVALYDEPIFASDCSTISESESYCLDFVFYQLLCKQQTIYKAQTGGAQPHIHAKDLNPIPFAFPPLPEQTAIASVLTEMDAELAVLEQRREKTRALKQAMMQELLTGRIRLL